MRMPPFHSFDKFCFDAEKGFGKQFVRLDDEKTKLLSNVAEQSMLAARDLASC